MREQIGLLQFSDHQESNSSININLLKEVAYYWSNSFDWKTQEAYINSFQQFEAKANGINLHFIYEKGRGNHRIPLLLLHGWGSNFTAYLKVISLLKKENPNMDIIVPSIPGFGFSENPDCMSSAHVSTYIHQLMSHVLRYSSCYVHGCDYGAFIGEKLALKYPEYVKGLHLSYIPYYHFIYPK